MIQSTTRRAARPSVMRFAFVLALCFGMSATLSSCARHTAGYKTEIADPIEPVNRAVFTFNNILDRALIGPVAQIYDAVFPGFVKSSVRNFMRNLRTPLVFANNVLQGDFADAGTAVARFVLNSTVGIAGLVDVAARQGLLHEDEDFGQTLAVWGLGDGFYLVLPVIGPSSLRDAGGIAVDVLADPVRIWANDKDKMWIYYTRAAVEGIDKRARAETAINDMRRNSLDYYAAVRSAYVQHRQSLIRDNGRRVKKSGDTHLQGAAYAAFPDYDEEY